MQSSRRSRENEELAPKQASLRTRFRDVRGFTRRLCAPLETEDLVAQSMPDVSPTKWHLAHTAWFFETFLLEPTGWEPVHPAYKVLFNSYYNGVGEQFARARRGLLTRPTVDEIWAYRGAVDGAVLELLDSDRVTPGQLAIVELGLQHEQQHQELMFTDIKHVLFQNPLLPAYAGAEAPSAVQGTPHRFVAYDGGRTPVGHRGSGFCFDNELPRHDVLASPFALGSRLVTTNEYRAFIADGGYRRPELWLSEGWAWVNENDISTPLYWLDDEQIFTLHGARAQLPDEPVIHVSLYEADAYATWAQARLPREHELEIALCAVADPSKGHFAESGVLHARPAKGGEGPAQLFGDAWEWTQSSYSPYPGYRAPDGAIGEYNGKFMCNQHVLRGGSCVTPKSHIRASYRNFFPASARWQVTGIRLARDL